MFSAASDRRSGQVDRKRDSSVAESHTRVKNKEGIEDPKSSLKMLILQNNCQFSSKFLDWAWRSWHFSNKYGTQMHSVDKNWTLNLWTFEPVNGYNYFDHIQELES